MTAAKGFVFALLLTVGAQDKRCPVPEPPALKEAETLIRDLFKDDYAKKATADRLALARKLLSQGIETRDNPAAAYVLLRESKDLATVAGDPDLAMKAVDALAKSFDGSWAPMRLGVLAAAEKGAKTPEDFHRFALGYLSLADDAMGVEDGDLAERAASAGLQAAKKSRDVALASRLEAKVKECADFRGRVDKVAKAKDALGKNPEDAAANGTLGAHLCFARDEWASGLPLLAKGADADLKALALRDLAQPAAAAEKIALGDAWWDRGEKESGETRARLRGRAAFWYRQGIAEAGGLLRLRIEKRLAEAGGSAPKPAKGDVDLLALVDPKFDSITGAWRRIEGGLVSPVVNEPKFASCAIPYVPPAEYDLSVEAERRSGASSLLVGLVGGGRQFAMELDGYDGNVKKSFSGLDRVRGLSGLTNGTGFRGNIFADRKAHTVLCRVRNDRVTIAVDGQELLTWPADYAQVSRHELVAVANTESLFLGAWNSEYAVHRMTLLPVGGEGRLLRPGDAKPNPKLLQDGLVAWWKCDEGKGTVLTNKAIPQNTGTLTAAVGWTKGRQGPALKFDGTKNCYATCRAEGLPRMDSPLTLSWWHNQLVDPGRGENLVVLSDDFPTGSIQAALGDGNVNIWKAGGVKLLGGAAPGRNQWAHGAYVFDGARHALFINGRLADSSTTPAQPTPITHCVLGRWWQDVGTNPYGGLLSDVRIYNRALSEAEIQNLASGSD